MYIVKVIENQKGKKENEILKEVFKIVEAESENGEKVNIKKSIGVVSLDNLETLEKTLMRTITEMEAKLVETVEQIKEFKKV